MTDHEEFIDDLIGSHDIEDFFNEIASTGNEAGMIEPDDNKPVNSSHNNSNVQYGGYGHGSDMGGQNQYSNSRHSQNHGSYGHNQNHNQNQSYSNNQHNYQDNSHHQSQNSYHDNSQYNMGYNNESNNQMSGQPPGSNNYSQQGYNQHPDDPFEMVDTSQHNNTSSQYNNNNTTADATLGDEFLSDLLNDTETNDMYIPQPSKGNNQGQGYSGSYNESMSTASSGNYGGPGSHSSMGPSQGMYGNSNNMYNSKYDNDTRHGAPVHQNQPGRSKDYQNSTNNSSPRKEPRLNKDGKPDRRGRPKKDKIPKSNKSDRSNNKNQLMGGPNSNLSPNDQFRKVSSKSKSSNYQNNRGGAGSGPGTMPDHRLTPQMSPGSGQNWNHSNMPPTSAGRGPPPLVDRPPMSGYQSAPTRGSNSKRNKNQPPHSQHSHGPGHGPGFSHNQPNQPPLHNQQGLHRGDQEREREMSRKVLSSKQALAKSLAEEKNKQIAAHNQSIEERQNFTQNKLNHLNNLKRPPRVIKDKIIEFFINDHFLIENKLIEAPEGYVAPNKQQKNRADQSSKKVLKGRQDANRPPGPGAHISSKNKISPHQPLNRSSLSSQQMSSTPTKPIVKQSIIQPPNITRPGNKKEDNSKFTKSKDQSLFVGGNVPPGAPTTSSTPTINPPQIKTKTFLKPPPITSSKSQESVNSNSSVSNSPNRPPTKRDLIVTDNLISPSKRKKSKSGDRNILNQQKVQVKPPQVPQFSKLSNLQTLDKHDKDIKQSMSPMTNRSRAQSNDVASPKEKSKSSQKPTTASEDIKKPPCILSMEAEIEIEPPIETYGALNLISKKPTKVRNVVSESKEIAQNDNIETDNFINPSTNLSKTIGSLSNLRVLFAVAMFLVEEFDFSLKISFFAKGPL